MKAEIKSKIWIILYSTSMNFKKNMENDIRDSPSHRFDNYSQRQNKQSQRSASLLSVKYRYSYDSSYGLLKSGKSLSSLPTVSHHERSKLPPALTSPCSSINIKKSSPLTIMGYKSDSSSPPWPSDNQKTCWNQKIKYNEDKIQNNSGERRCSNNRANSNNISHIRWKTRSSSLNASKYPDPLDGASNAYLQRISDLASYQLESMKYEKSKKKKKKKSQEFY